MKTKILLINPTYPIEESPSPPFGLMSLAAYLIKKDFDVLIEDYVITPYSEGRLHKVISEYKPDVIGGTGVTMNINRSIDIMKQCKRISPETLTVLGGPHASFDAENLLTGNDFIDVIVRGEGEITLVELLNNIDQKENFKYIKGISYKIDSEIFHNESREFIDDINTLPFPARHLVQLSKYRATGFPVNMITSRGCPHECIFCVGRKMVGRKVRYFDVNRVVDEFEMLSKMKFKQINIVDDLFTSNKKRCINICREIVKRGIDHPWSAFARVDTISEELLIEMKKAGCTLLCFGIESGNQEILNKVKKRINLDMCRKAVDLCRKVGIDPMASYILGLPGETAETIHQTLQFSKELSQNYGYHVLAPFPGTEVREKCHEYGMKILTDDWDRYDANQSVAESIFLSYGEVDRIVKKFYDGIKSIVKISADKFNAGEEISKENELMIKNIQSQSFTLRLIKDETIERFSFSFNGSDRIIINDFIDFVMNDINLPRDDIESEVMRLFDLECIKPGRNGAPALSWT